LRTVRDASLIRPLIFTYLRPGGQQQEVELPVACSTCLGQPRVGLLGKCARA
jgi:hypothetical protein